MRALKQSVIAMLVCVMLSVVAFADKKSEKVTFWRDVVVNGALVKQGTYKVQVDEQANELKIINGQSVIASTKYHLENKQNKNSQTVVTFTQKDSNNMLNGIGFKGETQTYIVSNGSDQSATPQQ